MGIQFSSLPTAGNSQLLSTSSLIGSTILLTTGILVIQSIAMKAIEERFPENYFQGNQRGFKAVNLTLVAALGYTGSLAVAAFGVNQVQARNIALFSVFLNGLLVILLNEPTIKVEVKALKSTSADYSKEESTMKAVVTVTTEALGEKTKKETEVSKSTFDLDEELAKSLILDEADKDVKKGSKLVDASKLFSKKEIEEDEANQEEQLAQMALFEHFEKEKHAKAAKKKSDPKPVVAAKEAVKPIFSFNFRERWLAEKNMLPEEERNYPCGLLASEEPQPKKPGMHSVTPKELARAFKKLVKPEDLAKLSDGVAKLPEFVRVLLPKAGEKTEEEIPKKMDSDPEAEKQERIATVFALAYLESVEGWDYFAKLNKVKKQ